jgi:hypothetical protein
VVATATQPAAMAAALLPYDRATRKPLQTSLSPDELPPLAPALPLRLLLSHSGGFRGCRDMSAGSERCGPADDDVDDGTVPGGRRLGAAWALGADGRRPLGDRAAGHAARRCAADPFLTRALTRRACDPADP